jgi:hypothetical protein
MRRDGGRKREGEIISGIALTTEQQERQQDEQQQEEALTFAVLDGVVRASVEEPGVEAEDRREENVDFAEAEEEEALDGVEGA